MLALNLPRRFNAAAYFIDRNVDEGRGEKTALFLRMPPTPTGNSGRPSTGAPTCSTELGVRMEERVLLLLKDTPEMIFSFYGAIKMGAVPIPDQHPDEGR